MADASTAQLRDTWEAAAPGWARWEHVFTEALADATEDLLDAAGVAEGMQVLDVACGAGSQTLRAAERVGPTGRVVASDISAIMLEHVQRNAVEAGLGNITTVESAAEDLDLTDGSIDAAFSRLGLMLFAAPGRALAALTSSLKPDARFAALVFTTPQRNPFFGESMAILLRHADAAPPGPGAPGLFALGYDGVLAGLLSESGLDDVRASVVDATLRFAGAEDALQFLQEGGGAYRAVAAGLGEAERSRAWSEVGENLTHFESDQGFEAEMELVIGSGARPADR